MCHTVTAPAAQTPTIPSSEIYYIFAVMVMVMTIMLVMVMVIGDGDGVVIAICWM